MFRDDYILRLIREFAQLLTYVLGLNRGREFEKALRASEEAYKRLLKLDPLLVRKLSASDLVDILSLGDQTIFARDKCLFLAALQAADAEAFEGRGDEDRWFDAALKALEITLLAFMRWDEADLPGFALDVETTRARLAGYIVPPDSLRLLLAYYEEKGQFARAEDLLFQAIEQAPQELAWFEMGAGFYDRLLHMPDAVLRAGDLPRAEVQAGLAELRQRRRGR